MATPLNEIWDRELRNAIFHSDYSVHLDQVRFCKDSWPHAYSGDRVLVLVNRALAYFDVLRFFLQLSIRSYTAPKVIEMHPLNAAIPNEKAVVMVRERYGAIGLKHAWNFDELRRGCIPWSYGRFRAEELRSADADPLLAFFPLVAGQSENQREE